MQLCVHKETAVEPWARGTFIDTGVGDEFAKTPCDREHKYFRLLS